MKTKQLINILEAIEQELELSIHGCILESDQGNALKVICKEFDIIQLICLRHFLSGIKDSLLRFLVKYVIEAATPFELDNEIVFRCLEIF